jgi:hypothetical protein
MDWSRASRRTSHRTAPRLAALAAASLLAARLATASLAVLALAALAAPLAGAAHADTAPADAEARIRAIKQAARRMLAEGAEARSRDARANQAWRRWKAAHPHSKSGERVRKASEREEALVPMDRIGAPSGPGAAPLSVQSVPTNVRCNNPAGDAANAGQSEEYIARWGNYVLVAWNDGQGFNTGGDIQNYAYSTDGGATFIQPAGGIPHPAGAVGFVWASDPVVTVNEKTGEFFYAGLIDSGGTGVGPAPFSGLAVAHCTFPGGAAPPVWGATKTVRTVNTSNYFIDKEWVAVDSLTNRVLVSYTLFDFTTGVFDSIDFQRSGDGGNTWGPILTLSSNAAAGYVQGSRPIAGPNGEVYVTWYEIGQSTAYDFMRIRKSVNGGTSFGGEVEVCRFYANFATGAPGFNRLQGIQFPAIAVDRTGGPHRGRVYVAWNESVNWYDDLLGGGGNQNEVEPNSVFTTATPFTIGQKLRGNLSSTSDADFFSFAATQGTNYIFFADSLSTILQYTMRVICSDGATSLALSGADVNTAGGFALIDWTCPASGTYYLRLASNGTSGNYRIETGTNGANTGERSRDHRDIFVAHSDDGSTWVPATRANDDPPYFDDWLPEVSVGADGMVYTAWYDWRDAVANCGASSNVYVTRSADGGATWQPSVPVTSVATTWSQVASNIAPNQGDYIALRSDGRYMIPSWADGRNNNPDVWATNFDTGVDIVACPSDSSVSTTTTLALEFDWINRNTVFGNSYKYQLFDTAGWPVGGQGSIALGPGAATSASYSIVIPDTTVNVNDLTFQLTDANGMQLQTCRIHYDVSGHVGPPPPAYSFALASPVPNPMTTSSRIDFTLVKAANVKLVIYGLNGQRIRTLLDGPMSAGPQSVNWDGLDDHGHRARAGVYFYRLETPGYQANRRLVFTP